MLLSLLVGADADVGTDVVRENGAACTVVDVLINCQMQCYFDRKGPASREQKYSFSMPWPVFAASAGKKLSTSH